MAIFISTKSGVILFELFSLFSSHMDRAVCIGNAKEFRFHSELEIYEGNRIFILYRYPQK